MLVLTRKKMESIEIGDDICITVCHVGKGTVVLGIEAPRHLNIKRSELPDLKPVETDSDVD